MSVVRIGAGAGFQGDRLEPAVDLAERGALDYLVFECLGERTIALAQQERMTNPAGGFDPLLERRMRAVLSACRKNGTRIITNMGAANPLGAAERTVEIAQELGLTGLKVAAVTGDDVLDRIGSYVLDETGAPAAALRERLVSANAYIGVDGLVAALEAGADVVICGRASDPTLFLAPLVYEFGWALATLPTRALRTCPTLPTSATRLPWSIQRVTRPSPSFPALAGGSPAPLASSNCSTRSTTRRAICNPMWWPISPV